MHKLFNTLLIGVTAIFLSSSYGVYAAEHTVFKCTKADNSIVFQDFACGDAKTVETVVVQEPKSQDNTGLRDYEKVVLARSTQRVAQETNLRAAERIARINRHKTIDSNINIRRP